MTAILVEIDLVAPDGEGSVLRLTDGAVRPFPPGDADRPNATWDDRVLEPPSIRRTLFDDLSTLSPGLGLGAMTLANADRGLDALKGHAWGEVRALRWEEGQTFAEATPILTGRCVQPTFGIATTQPGRVTVGLYDVRSDLEGALQTSLYGGQNGVGGTLYDGEPDGLAGKPKPLAFGRLDDAHVPAPLVNPGVLAYQLHDGPIAGSEQIFDRGDDAGLDDDGDYAGGAFDAFSPSAASYATDLGRGLLKINGDLVGAAAFGCRGSNAGGYVETVGPICARLLALAGVAPAKIDASIAAFDDAALVGAWFGEPVAAREAIGWVARSALAAIAPDRAGVWRADRLAPPGASTHDIPADDVIAIEEGDTAAAPAGEVRVGWGKVWTPLRRQDLAPALLGTSTETRLASDYRWAVAEDATAKARWPGLWRTLTITTALREEAAAIALAAELRTLFGLRPDGAARRSWRVILPMTDARLGVQLGASVRLTYPALGLDEDFLLIGEEVLRPRRDAMIWTVWG